MAHIGQGLRIVEPRVHILVPRRKIALLLSAEDYELAMTYPSVFAKSLSTCAILWFIAAFMFLPIAGCNSDTCFVGVINAPNSGVVIGTGNLPAVCSGLQTPAAMSVTVQLPPVCTGCSATRQVSSVHLTVSGIEMHPGMVADENSPDWQEIAPEAAKHPVQLALQLELPKDPASSGAVMATTISGRIPAGRYYQLRLRLVDLASSQSMQLSAKNSCGAAGASCLVTKDGELHALRTLDGTQYLRVAISSPIDVHAGQPNPLRIELSPEWLLQNSSSGVVEVAPLLRGHLVSKTSAATGSL